MWYYVINNQQHGPLSREGLAQKLNGEIAADTLVWKEGMTDWVKANELEEFRNFSASPNTPPPPAPIQSNNPYAAPAVADVQITPTTDYPLPQVKPARFGLLLSLGSISLLSIIAGYVLLFSTIFSASSSIANQEIERIQEEQANEGYQSDESTHLESGGAELEMANAIEESMIGFFSLIGIGWVLSIVTFIIGLVYLHRAWTILQPSGTSTSPGTAVGFLFIPFFNLYWLFIAYRQWAEEWNALCQRFPSLALAPRATSGVFLAMAICCCSVIFTNAIGLFAMAVLYFIGMKSMCDVINHAAVHSRQSNDSPFR